MGRAKSEELKVGRPRGLSVVRAGTGPSAVGAGLGGVARLVTSSDAVLTNHGAACLPNAVTILLLLSLL